MDRVFLHTAVAVTALGVPLVLWAPATGAGWFLGGAFSLAAFGHLVSSVDRLLCLDKQRASALARRSHAFRVLISAAVLWAALVMPGVEFWATLAGLMVPKLVVFARALGGGD